MAMNPIVTQSNADSLFAGANLHPLTDTIPTALIITEATKGGTVEGDSPYARVPFVDDVDASVVGEGKQITAVDPNLHELHFTTHKIGVIAPYSFETSQNPTATTLLSASLRRSILKKADKLFLQGDGLNIKGLGEIENVVDGGSIDGNTGLDPLLDAIATVSDNGGNPTSLIMNHGTWAGLVKLKDSSGRYLVPRDSTNTPTPALFGIPVVLNNNAEQGTVILNDRTQVLAVYSQVRGATSRDFLFDSDALVMRITFRMGFGVPRPNRIAKLTVATSGK